MKSIRLKLVTIFTLVILIITAVIGFININIVSNNLMEDAYSDLETMAASEAKYINSLVETDLKYIEGVAQNSIILDSEIPWEEKASFLEKEAKRAGYEVFALADKNGNAKVFNSKGDTVNIGSRDYFKKALNGESTVSDVIVSNATGDLVVIYATPIHENGKIVGVFYGRKEGTTLCSVASSVTYRSTGYCYIINNEGTTVGHQNIELVKQQDNGIENAKTDESVKKLGEFTERMIAGGIGNGSYDYDGVNKIAAYAPIQYTPWIAVLGLDTSEIVNEVNAMRNMLLIFILGGVVFGAVITFFVSGIITKPIKKITKVAKQIAEGDFDVALDIKTKDEVGQLADAFNLTIDQLVEYQGYIDEIAEVFLDISKGNLMVELQRDYTGQFEKIKINAQAMLDNLNSTLTQINEAANQVNGGSDQVADGAQALSQGATEQASSIEELSAGVGEMSDQIKKNAENAALVRGKAEDSGKVLGNSNEEMQKMIAAMEKISQRSAEISKIIKLIDDIAFQTNILALNAAVEAARAGDAGKGFAVVADEVRNLAGKSTEAAKSTTALIEETLEAVKSGTVIANSTAQSLNESATGSREVISLIFEIANASEEQASAIEQINLGIEQISAVVQTNAATAEESAAASEELSGQANLLKDLISAFEIKEVSYQGNSDESHYDDESYAAYGENANSEMGDSDISKY